QSFCSILVHSLIPLSDSLRAVSAPAPGDVYTLSLHDALPIWPVGRQRALRAHPAHVVGPAGRGSPAHGVAAVGGDALSVGSHRRGEPVAAPGGFPQGASERRLTWRKGRASLPGTPGRGSRTVLERRVVGDLAPWRTGPAP